MMEMPNPFENIALINDCFAGLSSRGTGLMVTSVFLSRSSCETSMNGSTSGARFGFCRKQQIRRRAVPPYGVTNGFERVGLQCRLGEQTGDETAKQIARAALRELRIAGGIHEQFTRVATHQSLMTFQHDEAAAELF